MEETKPKHKKIRIVEDEYNLLKERALRADEYLDSLKRLQAEFENAKKRIEKDRQAFLKFSNETLMKALLPLIDSFENAIATFSAKGESAALRRDLAEGGEDAHFDGIKLIYKQMFDILASEGLSRIKAAGERFDPNVHEAIMEIESNEHPEGTIVEELRPGYMYHDKCLRPAIVKVAKRAEQKIN